VGSNLRQAWKLVSLIQGDQRNYCRRYLCLSVNCCLRFEEK
jgi:hypothetical protein